MVQSNQWKRDMRFGIWNDRNLYRSGSLTTVARVLARYKLDLVGVWEVRWAFVKDLRKCENTIQGSCVLAIYTGCPRRNVPDLGRVFLMLKYTDITQNTYVQS